MKTVRIVAPLLIALVALACGGRPARDSHPAAPVPDAPVIRLGVCQRTPIPALTPPDLSGPSVVTLDERGTFVVNGVPFWPFGFYGYPDSDEGLAELKDAGFNSFMGGPGCCEGGALQQKIDFLSAMRDKGFLVGGHGPSMGEIQDAGPEVAADWLAQLGAAGGMLFYYTYDEPTLSGVPTAEAEAYHQALSTLDPDHPNALVEQAMNDFTVYMPATDFMMIDPYPSPALPLDMVRDAYIEADAASDGTKRVFGVPQAFDWYEDEGIAPEGHVWRPSVREMRNMAYQYMVLGANGMFYFSYNAVHSQPDRWNGMVAIGHEVGELMPLLVLPDVRGVVTQTPDPVYVSHSVRQLNGATYILIVSTWYDAVTLTYDLSALGSNLCVVDYFANQALDATGGRVAVTLPPEGATVLQVVPQ